VRSWLPVIALLAGCAQEPAGSQDQPDILVILVPGLRADAPGVPGAEAAFLEAFGDRPMRRFTAAYAQSVSEWVSTGSLLTGRYPGSIPLCGRVSAAAGDGQPWCTELPAELPTLPRVAGLYGYRSAMMTMGNVVVPGANAGFRAVHVAPAVDGRTDVEHLIELLDAHTGAPEPLMAMVVSPDLDVQGRPDLRGSIGLPAEPSACEQRVQQAGRPRLDGRAGTRDATSPLEPAAVTASSPSLEPRCTLDTWDPAADGMPGEAVPAYPWGTLDRDRVVAVYTAEAARLGQDLARAIDSLEHQPWVIITSPHGLDLGEVSGSLPAPKAFATHRLLLDRTLRVPLVIIGPDVTASSDLGQPVELVDLMPTLASLAGAVPPAGLPGQDLLAPDFAPDPSATAYAEFGDMLWLRQGPWALTLRTLNHQATALDPALTEAAARPVDDPVFHLHRVDRDPLQETGLKTEQPALAEQLRTLMHATRSGPAAPPEDLAGSERLLELRLQGSEGYW